MATCPECDAEIEVEPDDVDEMEVGDPWSCDACGSSLRVASLEPLEFDADDEADEDDEDELEEDEEVDEDELDEDEDDDEDSDPDWDE